MGMNINVYEAVCNLPTGDEWNSDELQVAILGEFRVTGFIEIALQGLVSESI
jgi:hypothetical protein